uniref:Peptidase S26 domain-containing protein n=1 Tax=Vespula pensylvanica TaxID=30213 RepID=A0A834P6L6_VESPE|nr:hypothetical protein H0235_006369 [Vespula pensylvanica]
MEPTIHSKDILFTEHISTRLRWYKKGDIIISICPSNPRQHICKRVVGLPGDSIRHGFTTHIVPIGHVWLEGDNSSNSTDSRIYGPVPQGLLRGRAIFARERKRFILVGIWIIVTNVLYTPLVVLSGAINEEKCREKLWDISTYFSNGSFKVSDAVEVGRTSLHLEL